MASKQLSLHDLIRFLASFRSQEPTSRNPTIIALHGRGSNEQDLIPNGLALEINEATVKDKFPIENYEIKDSKNCPARLHQVVIKRQLMP